MSALENPSAEPSRDATLTLEPPRALVVDDAATIRFYHCEILRRAGFGADEAANGFEALERALGVRYDLILVDINMPQMDGLALIRRLRAEPIGASCPIITISTESGSATAEAIQAGANLFLGKPVDAGHLLLIVEGLASALTTRPADRSADRSAP